jgi:hypothetical protein
VDHVCEVVRTWMRGYNVVGLGADKPPPVQTFVPDRIM